MQPTLDEALSALFASRQTPAAAQQATGEAQSSTESSQIRAQLAAAQQAIDSYRFTKAPAEGASRGLTCGPGEALTKGTG